jgi:hypothetical protein
MSTLTPWALGPFEIILHAEMHYRVGDDLDRRIAIVGFDNAIELSIHTYLSLHPIQRQNRTYPKTDVEKWLDNFHSKVEFFINEVTTRKLAVVCDQAKFVWYHEVRNGQYHVGGATIPQARELDGIREAAMWVFSVLFEIDDVVGLIEQHLTARSGDDLPKKNEEYDRLIDGEYGTVELAGKTYYVSEVVHRFDPVWYSELAGEIKARDAANVVMNEDPPK